MTFSLPIDGIALLGLLERHYLESKAEALKERLNRVHLRSGPPAHVSDGIGGARGQHREAPVRDAGTVDEIEQALSQAHVGVRSTHSFSPLARRRRGPAGSIEPETLPEPLQGGSLLVCLLRCRCRKTEAGSRVCLGGIALSRVGIPEPCPVPTAPDRSPGMTALYSSAEEGTGN